MLNSRNKIHIHNLENKASQMFRSRNLHALVKWHRVWPPEEVMCNIEA